MGIVIYEVEKRDSFRSHLSTLITARIVNWGNLLRKVDRKGYYIKLLLEVPEKSSSKLDLEIYEEINPNVKWLIRPKV